MEAEPELEPSAKRHKHDRKHKKHKHKHKSKDRGKSEHRDSEGGLEPGSLKEDEQVPVRALCAGWPAWSAQATAVPPQVQACRDSDAEDGELPDVLPEAANPRQAPRLASPHSAWFGSTHWALRRPVNGATSPAAAEPPADGFGSPQLPPQPQAASEGQQQQSEPQLLPPPPVRPSSRQEDGLPPAKRARLSAEPSAVSDRGRSSQPEGNRPRSERHSREPGRSDSLRRHEHDRVDSVRASSRPAERAHDSRGRPDDSSRHRGEHSRHRPEPRDGHTGRDSHSSREPGYRHADSRRYPDSQQPDSRHGGGSRGHSREIRDYGREPRGSRDPYRSDSRSRRGDPDRDRRSEREKRADRERRPTEEDRVSLSG